MKYAISSKEKVRAMGTFSISTVSAIKVCRVLNRKKFTDAKSFLERLVKQKASIKRKYFTKTSEEILKLLNQLENNAKKINIEPNSLILFISAHKGPTMYRSKRDRKHGVRLKMTHVQAVLSDKDGFGKKVP